MAADEHKDGKPHASSGAREAGESVPLRVAGAQSDGRAHEPSRSPRRSIVALRWARRASQATFLALFLYLLIQTTFRGTFAAAADQPVRLPWPVEAFFLVNPYAAWLTLLSSGTVYRGLLWSLVVVALTVVFGRVFCGWICPLGTLHHVLGWVLPSRRGKGSARIAANRTSPGRQRVKLLLLVAFTGAAATGSAIGGLFDPIALAVRSIGLAVLPAAHWCTSTTLENVADSNVRSVQIATDAAQDWLAHTLWSLTRFHFHEAWIIGVLFVAVLVMNRFIPRFWCRVLCPLGALLGLMSRFSLFGMRKDHARCTDCNLCLLHCQGADSPQGGVKWRQDECHMCLNCECACPEDVIQFGFLPSRRSTDRGPDASRRAALASVAAGAAFVPLARASDAIGVNQSARWIRPPGALAEPDFLDRCIRCGECMKVCPNNALHPALAEGGIEGLWTPILIPRIGYCEQSCVLCGQACPTGAIVKFTEQAKLGVGQPPIKMGTAFFDFGRCLPWAMNIPCIVCEEFCPTSPKAIWVEKVQTRVRDDIVEVQRPRVEPALCTGCGACEKVCPVQDRPAVYVTSVGESRSSTNVVLLTPRTKA